MVKIAQWKGDFYQKNTPSAERQIDYFICFPTVGYANEKTFFLLTRR